MKDSARDTREGARQTIHLAIAFDVNYLTPFYALATSIFANNASNRIHFHLIATGISDEDKQRLTTYVQTVTFYNIDEVLVKKFVLLNSWTSAVYYRLFFPLLVNSDIGKLLYIDTDTIIVNDLHELFTTDLEHFPLGAVYDNYVKSQPLLDITNEGDYFNSGVLLIDTQRWREQKISEKAFQYLHDFPERILFVDQCALNAVLHQNWKKLPEKYNLLYSFVPDNLTRWQVSEFLEDKVIVHFTLQRPWHMLCRNRLKFLYHRYLNLSPVRRESKRYTDFAIKKLPAWTRIKLYQLYLDFPGLANFWRQTKKMVHD